MSESVNSQRILGGQQHCGAERFLKDGDLDQRGGAVDPDDPSFPGYGVARFVRTEDDPTVAEVAIVVIDDAQREGLGAIFMSILYILAGLGGYRALRSTVLPQNQFMGDWLIELGATRRLVEGVYELTHPVYSDLDEFPDNPAARSFKRKLTEIRALLLPVREGFP